MNERIDQLLVKAGAYFGSEGVVYDRFNPKYFAALIVLECTDVVSNILTSDPYRIACVKVRFKDRFGVAYTPTPGVDI